MDWEDVLRIAVLAAVGFLALRKGDFNGKYLLIAILAIAILWVVLRAMGYD